MKKTYVSPDLELFTIRPDEQIAVTCNWVNSAAWGDACWNPNVPDGTFDWNISQVGVQNS